MASDLDQYQKPSVAVDIVVFTITNNELKVLLIKRGQPPFSGMLSLPGGFVRINESLESAALRELEEETGVRDVYLEQLYTFGSPKRDPRGRVISVSYFVLVDSTKIKPMLTGKEMIENVGWFSVTELPKLGFDHDDIIKYALKRLRYKLEYTAVGLELLPDLFTLTDLQRMYEIILGQALDKRNFRKKILVMGILEQAKLFKKGAHRPAMLYRFMKGEPLSTFRGFRFEG